MDRNYYFRRKRHTYAACDAALAASRYIISIKVLIKTSIKYFWYIRLLKLAKLIFLSSAYNSFAIHLAVFSAKSRTRKLKLMSSLYTPLFH